MKPQNPKKTMRTLVVVCIITCLVAVAVGIVALAKQEYVIAAAMFLVAAWQVINYLKWRKLC